MDTRCGVPGVGCQDFSFRDTGCGFLQAFIVSFVGAASCRYLKPRLSALIVAASSPQGLRPGGKATPTRIDNVRIQQLAASDPQS